MRRSKSKSRLARMWKSDWTSILSIDSKYFQNIHEIHHQKNGNYKGIWMGLMDSDSAKEISSWLDLGSTWRGSRGGVFSRMWSSNASPFAVVLWLKDPSAAKSSYRADSLPRPNQKCCNNTWFGVDKSGLECVKIENSSPGCTYGFLLMLVGAENLLS